MIIEVLISQSFKNQQIIIEKKIYLFGYKRCKRQLYLKNLFPKIGNGKVMKILFPEKMIRHLLESHYFVKFGIKR